MIARVAASEHALLSITRALVGQVSAASVAPLLRKGHEIEKIRLTSMRLLKSTLATGLVLELARRGGWRAMRHLRAGAPVTGRLWERHQPPTFRFSASSFELCRWLAVAPLGNVRVPALTTSAPLTPADEVLFFLAAELLVQSGLPHVLKQTPVFRQVPLVWLGFAPYFAGEGAPVVPSFQSLLSGEGAVVLEAFQWELAHRWRDAERSRRQLLKCDAITQRSAVCDAVLSRFLQECAQAGRKDLADFLIEAGGVLLGKPVSAAEWLGVLDRTASLNDRAAARKAAGTYLRHLGTLQLWAIEARHTAFFEDHYQAAQAFAARWEVIGDGGMARVEGILRELDSLDFDARNSVEAT